MRLEQLKSKPIEKGGPDRSGTRWPLSIRFQVIFKTWNCIQLTIVIIATVMPQTSRKTTISITNQIIKTHHFRFIITIHNTCTSTTTLSSPVKIPTIRREAPTLPAAIRRRKQRRQTAMHLSLISSARHRILTTQQHTVEPIRILRRQRSWRHHLTCLRQI